MSSARIQEQLVNEDLMGIIFNSNRDNCLEQYRAAVNNVLRQNKKPFITIKAVTLTTYNDVINPLIQKLNPTIIGLESITVGLTNIIMRTLPKSVNTIALEKISTEAINVIHGEIFQLQNLGRCFKFIFGDIKSSDQEQLQTLADRFLPLQVTINKPIMAQVVNAAKQETTDGPSRKKRKMPPATARSPDSATDVIQRLLKQRNALTKQNQELMLRLNTTTEEVYRLTRKMQKAHTLLKRSGINADREILADSPIFAANCNDDINHETYTEEKFDDATNFATDFNSSTAILSVEQQLLTSSTRSFSAPTPHFLFQQRSLYGSLNQDNPFTLNGSVPNVIVEATEPLSPDYSSPRKHRHFV